MKTAKLEPHRPTILVVDDMPSNLDILINCLSEDYELQVALNGDEALESLSNGLPDLILLDIMMPGMSGLDLMGILKEQKETQDIPVIFLTALDDMENKTKGFEQGAVDYITKPFHLAELKSRTQTHLNLLQARRALEQQNEQLEAKVIARTRQMSELQKATIQSLSSLAESRDPETGGHILRTQAYVYALGHRLLEKGYYRDQLTAEMVENLSEVAPLHDIGKVGVPDRILLKPGRLTAEEFEEMKHHTTYGQQALHNTSQLLEGNNFIILAEQIAISHHERWDGTGYPHGLAGEAIPLAGRIMAIADVYDALISKRVYKEPIPHPKAVEIILQGSGSQFDPQLIEAFLEIAEDYRQIALQHCDCQEQRISLSLMSN